MELVHETEPAHGLPTETRVAIQNATFADREGLQRMEETFGTKTGTFAFVSDGEERLVGPGEGATIAAGTYHTWCNAGLEEADISDDKEGTMIETHNLRLITVERVHVEALLRNKRELSAILRVTVPNGWPHFPEAFSLPANGSRRSERPPTDWPGYFFIHPRERALVGNGGFTGEPDDSGAVEIGYEIAPEHRERGFATEAARAMIDYAFAHEEVRAVVAHTLAETNASNSVLRKVGMSFVAEVGHPEVGKTWRWRISRDDTAHQHGNVKE